MHACACAAYSQPYSVSRLAHRHTHFNFYNIASPYKPLLNCSKVPSSVRFPCAIRAYQLPAVSRCSATLVTRVVFFIQLLTFSYSPSANCEDNLEDQLHGQAIYGIHRKQFAHVILNPLTTGIERSLKKLLKQDIDIYSLTQMVHGSLLDSHCMAKLETYSLPL